MKAPEALKKWRDSQDLSQGEAGGMIGVSAATWCDWEHGKKDPRTDRARATERLTGGIVTVDMWADWASRRRSKPARKSRKRVH